MKEILELEKLIAAEKRAEEKEPQNINFLTDPCYSVLTPAQKLEKANAAYRSKAFLAQTAEKHYQLYHGTLHNVYTRIHALPQIYLRGTLQPNNMEAAAEIWEQFTGGHALDIAYLQWDMGMYREQWLLFVNRANEFRRQLAVLKGHVAAEERAAKEAAERRLERRRGKGRERQQRRRRCKGVGKKRLKGQGVEAGDAAMGMEIV